jgi:hypothetical protein
MTLQETIIDANVAEDPLTAALAREKAPTVNRDKEVFVSDACDVLG